ncbi:ABC transporter substrate-binding protein [Nocardia flavorosea]|uniref:ABC transporter substrate-binding protein n=1 Tax=Nocardia flavorosea TaxID=53429 RepID=UPI0018951E0E|nr:ABC transporter substrate-binding protein [Nocardia flavorosea]MBF6351084.1 ABC transporter substrate-binding protein [Nocardia flavorosea]
MHGDRAVAAGYRPDTGGGIVTIGVVIARSGRLASLGDPLDFVLSDLAPRLERMAPGGNRVRLVSRDSRSTAEGARQAVAELVRDERAVIVLTLAGTQVLPVVADTCEELGAVCVSSTFPWQVYYYGRGADDERPFGRTFHFCWGLDDIAGVFAELWECAGGSRAVGCLWNDGPQGNWSRHDRHGFAPAARARGHRLVDPPGYREPAADLDAHLRAFRDADVDLVTSAATARDLALFRATAARSGWRPRLITCSRWLAYPPGRGGPAGPPAQANVGTLVYWSPAHPYRSSLDDRTAADLAGSYEQRTGRQWLQPLGLAYALFEVAAHAVSTADDATDPASVASALRCAELETIAGRLDWASGPVPNVAVVPLAGGQWQPSARHGYELAVITPGRVGGLRPTGDLVVT